MYCQQADMGDNRIMIGYGSKARALGCRGYRRLTVKHQRDDMISDYVHQKAKGGDTQRVAFMVLPFIF